MRWRAIFQLLIERLMNNEEIDEEAQRGMAREAAH